MAAEILAARRRRLRADYEPISIPPESYAGCRTQADRIVRARKSVMDTKEDSYR